MIDTRLIPVIEGDVVTDVMVRVPRMESCDWCGIPLGRDGLPPVRHVHGKNFHTVCVRAYAADFVDRLTA